MNRFPQSGRSKGKNFRCQESGQRENSKSAEGEWNLPVAEAYLQSEKGETRGAVVPDKGNTLGVRRSTEKKRGVDLFIEKLALRHSGRRGEGRNNQRKEGTVVSTKGETRFRNH